MSADPYKIAFNEAVDRANATGRTMQLLAAKEYGKAAYTVRFAVEEGKRFGCDALGEFIAPGTPRMIVPPKPTIGGVLGRVCEALRPPEQRARLRAALPPKDHWILDIADAYAGMRATEDESEGGAAAPGEG